MKRNTSAKKHISTISRLLLIISSLAILIPVFSGIGINAQGTDSDLSNLHLRYDDHYDVTGKTVEIIDAGTPTSYKVGYGVADGTPDISVITLDGDTLIATGIGNAEVKIDGKVLDVQVTAAPISLILLAGQSNMRGSEGDPNQSIVCPDGMVYSIYGDDRGATNTKLTVNTARQFAPSALAGEYSTINVEGTTDSISGYPLNTLTEDGAGKMGADSGFAYEWIKQTGEKIWLINAGHGGSVINNWQKGNEDYEEALRLFTACQETLKKEIAAGHYTLSHMGYFGCQGCGDSGQTAKWYVNKYLAMHENFKTDTAFDHDGDSSTPDKVLEFGGIIPVRTQQGSAFYRQGTYAHSTTKSYYESFKDLQFTGPRVAQYWLGNNPDYEDIWLVCDIQEDWVWMPDGTNGVAKYFQSHYENGTVDYTTQVQQPTSWYTPTTPNAVHDTIHYNQIGYNEIGRESVRNTLIMLGEIEAPVVETSVEFLTWDGYTPAENIPASTKGNSSTLVVPRVYPIWKSKDITYTLSEGLKWKYYDLLADNAKTEGTLMAVGTNKTVSVAKGNPYSLFKDHLNELPESICSSLNLWSVLKHDKYYFNGSIWNTSGKVCSVTIPISAGDKIFATSFGKAGANGGTSSGIRLTFFDEYGVLKTLVPTETYSEFVANNGCIIAPKDSAAVNIVMWTDDPDNELYILNAAHPYESTVTAATCTEKGYTTHICKACKYSYVDGYTDPTGEHTDADGKWGADNLNHYRVCSCGATFDNAAHSGGTASCSKKAVCEVCSSEYGEINEKNHIQEIRNKVAATKEKEGYTGDTYCKDCGMKLASGEIIEKLPNTTKNLLWVVFPVGSVCIITPCVVLICVRRKKRSK